MNAIATQEERLFEMTLKAVIIYDDFDFAARAAALLERVAIRADEVMNWEIKPWRLDLLKSSSLAGAALAEARDADLIVAALGRTHLLPDELREWLERWAVLRQMRDAALMVLCPEETAGPMSSWNRMKEFAADRGLPFLADRQWADEAGPVEFVHGLWHRKQPVFHGFSRPEDPARTPHHWGINE